jgi:hypothetical protein
MIHHAGPNHVQLNVDHTAMQMLVGLNSGGVIAVFPERPLLAFALVIFLRGAPGDELHTLGDDVASSVFDEKVNVIACDYVIEHAQTEPLLRFEKPIQITAAIARKLHEKFSLMTAVGDVTDVAGYKMTCQSIPDLTVVG